MFFLALGIFENMGFVVNMLFMVFYFSMVMYFNISTAVNIFMYFFGSIFLFIILGGFMLDIYLNSFYMCLIFGFFEITVNILITILFFE